MLVKFDFSNFLSFNERQSLSFIASPDQSHLATLTASIPLIALPRVTKTALIFGANGSGKSNVLRALATLRSLVLSGSGLTASQFAAFFNPFSGRQRERTEFCVELLIDLVRYRYFVAYDAERILAEKLQVYCTAKSQRWFERSAEQDGSRETWTPFSPNFHGPREMWRKATSARAPFLSTAARLNATQLAPVMHWFEHCLDFVSSYDGIDQKALGEALQDPSRKAQIVSLLQSVDVPLSDIRVRMSDKNDAQFTKHPTLEFARTFSPNEVAWTPAMFESAGFRRMTHLFLSFMRSLDQGKLLVIDEIDASLHPLITRRLIQMIGDATVTGRQPQLLVTTHDSTLMDLQLLRRDAIWLVERGFQGSSTLFNIQRSKPRKGERLGRGYLRGRYGAIPHIQS